MNDRDLDEWTKQARKVLCDARDRVVRMVHNTPEGWEWPPMTMLAKKLIQSTQELNEGNR